MRIMTGGPMLLFEQITQPICSLTDSAYDLEGGPEVYTRTSMTECIFDLIFDMKCSS